MFGNSIAELPRMEKYIFVCYVRLTNNLETFLLHMYLYIKHSGTHSVTEDQTKIQWRHAKIPEQQQQQQQRHKNERKKKFYFHSKFIGFYYLFVRLFSRFWFFTGIHPCFM